MATYKVLQDIEAEDKLFGPLTLKQFIFAAVFIGLGFIGFTILTSSAPVLLKLPFVLVLVPPMAVFGFLAAPIGQDQPNDVWLLARLRFLFRPHRRIWNQDGISDFVTITAPKQEVHIYTDGLSQHEVRSRLQALANTVDSRGWAIKNVNTNLFAQPGYLTGVTSDRLIDPASLPQQVPTTDITAADDMLDTSSNSTAQHLDSLIQASSQTHRQAAISQMRGSDQAAPKPADYWFMDQAAPAAGTPQDFATFGSSPVVTPGSADDVIRDADETPEEKELAERLLMERQSMSQAQGGHLRTIRPLHDQDGNLLLQPADTSPVQQPGAASQSAARPVNQAGNQADDAGQTTPDPAIIGLAQNNDLNVATIARQAKRLHEDDGEVVISLH